MGYKRRSWITSLKGITITWLALAYSFSAFAQVTPGQDVGNSGDPLELIFHKAKDDAVSVLEAFKPDESSKIFFSELKKENVYEHLIKSWNGTPIYEAMKSDIPASEHAFPDATPPNQGHCAMTNIPGEDPSLIRFSMPKCRILLMEKGQEWAAMTLLHESTHHFGIGGSDPEEEFAWDVAVALYSYWQNQISLSEPRWTSLPIKGAPEERYQASSIMTDDGLILIWGGCNEAIFPNREDCQNYLNTGARLDIKDAVHPLWQPMSMKGAPEARRLATTVYTGEHNLEPLSQKMLLWGGCNGGARAECSTHLNSGAIYDLEEDQWEPLPNPARAKGRTHHTASWVHDQMIVYGGLSKDGRSLGDMHSLRYTEESGWQWQQISVPEKFVPRFGHTATWTGSHLIIWGGCAQEGIASCRRPLNDGFSFNPTDGSFEALPTRKFIKGRLFHSAVWTGGELIIWGGKQGLQKPLNDGAILRHLGNNPEWTKINALLPDQEQLGRYSHQASWTGHSMLVFGGEAAPNQFKQSTLKFEFHPSQPDLQTWEVVPALTRPIGRKGHVQYWYDDSLFIWGGFGGNKTFLPTGAILKNAD